jgi:hypothetical protein
MENLSPAVFADLWRAYRAGRAAEDESLAAFQKFMVMHQDMHEVWDRLAEDPSTPLVVEGENLMLHVAMDVATEGSLSRNEPPGIHALFAGLVKKGFPEGEAFHVISQAMMHEFLIAAERGKEMELPGFFKRAADYCRQAVDQRG